jgi:hypothetical protein
LWSGRRWGVPVAIVFSGALFTIRGYTVTPDAIRIHRLFWTTRFSLFGLHSAKVEPEAMRRSIRTFGNGGLFSFSGWFYSKTLGAYRAFVTDPHRAVVLHFDRRNIVLSPSAPEDLVHDIRNTIHAV